MGTRWCVRGIMVLALLLVVSAGEVAEEHTHLQQADQSTTQAGPSTTKEEDESSEEAKEEGESPEEAKGESPEEAKALGLTMVGGIFFVMGMYYLTHSWDPDIRFSTWAAINDTISIFCAVMLYSSVSELGEALTHEADYGSVGQRELVVKLFAVFWYLCLLGSIAWCVGIGMGRDWRMDVSRKEPFHHGGGSSDLFGEGGVTMEKAWAVYNQMAYGPLDEKVKETGAITKPLCTGKNVESSFSRYTQMKNNLRCCTLFAHTTGFAGIAGWKIRMDSGWFKQGPWHCATLVPLGLLAYYVVIKVTQIFRRLFFDYFLETVETGRRSEAREGEEEDELIEVFEEAVVDGENDFFGLFMSTIIVSSIKFGVGGDLDLEEDEEYKFNRGMGEALIMYFFAGAFFVAAYALLELRRKLEELADEKDKAHNGCKKPGAAFYDNFSKSIWKWLPEGQWLTDFIIEEGAKTIKRLGELFVKILTMSFAWCFMYGTQWFLGHFLKGQGSVLAISLAMSVSVCSVVFLYVLDFVADESEKDDENKGSGKEDDEVLRTLLESIGILIGFVWESAFDDALEGIAGEEEGMSGAWVKPVLGILTVAVILPVWRLHIVPMEVEKGYILGFIPSKVAHRMERIFNDKSIGEDVQNSARVAFEEAMMVMLAFDKPKEEGGIGVGAETIHGLLDKHKNRRSYQRPYEPPGTPLLDAPLPKSPSIEGGLLVERNPAHR